MLNPASTILYSSNKAPGGKFISIENLWNSYEDRVICTCNGEDKIIIDTNDDLKIFDGTHPLGPYSLVKSIKKVPVENWIEIETDYDSFIISKGGHIAVYKMEPHPILSTKHGKVKYNWELLNIEDAIVPVQLLDGLYIRRIPMDNKEKFGDYFCNITSIEPRTSDYSYGFYIETISSFVTINNMNVYGSQYTPVADDFMYR